VHVRTSVAVLSMALLTVSVASVSASAATIPPRSTDCPSPGSPVMTSFAESPGTVNVKSKSGRIVFTAKATDATQNITKVTVSAASPFHRTPRPVSVALALTAGTQKNGTWKGTLTIPRFSQDGTWKLTEVNLYDAAGGNSTYSTDYSNGGNGLGAGSPTSFRVVSRNDLTPPTITSLKLSHSSANTATQTQTLVATVTAKDNLAGVGRITVSGSATVGGHHYYTRGGTVTVNTPTAKAHAYRVSFLVPKGVGSGTHTWSLGVSIADPVGNSVGLDRAQLLAKHSTSTFKVISRTDVTPPRLTGLDFSTTSVNALSSDQKVTVTGKATDAVSGVARVIVNLTSHSGFFSSSFFPYSASAVLTGSAGNAVNWKGSLTIPRCSDPGTWTVTNVVLADATYVPGTDAGNYATVTTAQLAMKGYPNALHVQALDVTAPRFTVPTVVPRAGPLVVTFTEPTLWTGTDVLSVRDDTSGTVTTGTWMCTNGGGATVGCADDGADVMTATFQPASSLTVGDSYLVLTTSYGFDITRGIFDIFGNGPTALAIAFTAN
jgi:hypothetical protein